MYGYVYLTTNTANGKIYIGQKKSKVFLGERYLGSGVKLKSAIKHYGKEVFIVEMIDSADTLEQLNEKEIYWISYYNATDEEVGYNISFGGGVLDGFEVWNKGKKGLQKASEETRRKISEGNSGKVLPEEQRKKISASNSGKKRTEEQNQKNRERNIGRKFINKDGINKTVPGDQVQKYLDEGWNLGKIIRHKYVPWNKGQTKETNEMIRQYAQKHTGHKHTEESKEANREKHVGRRYINNGKDNKVVFPEDIQSYLDAGWVLGMIRNKKPH